MNMAEVLEQLSIPFEIDGRDTRPGWLQLRCPQCLGDKYLGINTRGNYAHCWRCGFLKIAHILQQISEQSWQTVVSFLKQLDIAPLLQDETPIGKLVLPQGLGPLLPIHQNYLKRRNYDPEELEKLWGIRGIGLARKLSWRIWIPVTFRGKTVSWLTRAISDEGTRYVAASPQEEALPHKQLLFGEDRTRHAIVVTEGPFDVMRIGPGAVCTFGVSYSEQQLLKIAHHPIRYVAYDQEEKAQLKAKGLCEKLSLWPGKTTNIILDSKDPGESTKREILLLRRLLR